MALNMRMVHSMRSLITLVEAVNRQSDIEALTDQWQQVILQKVVEYVRYLASSNRSWHRGAADYYRDRNTSKDADDAVEAWWEAGAPVPEIDGLGIPSDGAAFNAWARSYIGLEPKDQ
jgi:hypothetical protein